MSEMTFCQHSKQLSAQEAKRPSSNLFAPQPKPAEQTEAKTQESKGPFAKIPAMTTETQLLETGVKQDSVDR